jgi:hypothetical protein
MMSRPNGAFKGRTSTYEQACLTQSLFVESLTFTSVPAGHVQLFFTHACGPDSVISVSVPAGQMMS